MVDIKKFCETQRRRLLRNNVLFGIPENGDRGISERIDTIAEALESLEIRNYKDMGKIIEILNGAIHDFGLARGSPARKKERQERERLALDSIETILRLSEPVGTPSYRDYGSYLDPLDIECLEKIKKRILEVSHASSIIGEYFKGRLFNKNSTKPAVRGLLLPYMKKIDALLVKVIPRKQKRIDLITDIFWGLGLEREHSSQEVQRVLGKREGSRS